MVVGGESFTLVSDSTSVTARIGVARLIGKDLRSFSLVDVNGNQIAITTRAITLQKAGYVLRIIWSLS